MPRDDFIRGDETGNMASHKGKLLVAAPTLADPNFKRAVVLLFDHSENGAGGIILNRPTDKTIADVANDLFSESSNWKKSIHMGGPVNGPLAIAHTEEEFADMEVFDGLYGTIAANKVLELIRKREEPSLVLFNYAGWGPGQLEGELAEDAWKLWPARQEHIFWTGTKDLWSSVMSEIGGEKLAKIVGLKHRPADPSMN